MNRVVKIIALAAAASMTASCGGNGGKQGDAQKTAGTAVEVAAAPIVEVTEAAARDVPDQSFYSSTVQAFAVNNIVPQTAGRIRAINVEVGDYVAAGQVLARMDDLSLEQARLQLVNDSTELSRVRALYEEGGVAKSDLEALELAYNVRRTTFENLEENTILRSPVTGFVTARNYDRNDMYSMSQPIFTIQQVVPVKLLVGISESEYTKVKKGDAVEITVDALPGQTFTGKVNRLYPTIDAATHTFQAEVLVSNSDRALRPGMYAKVSVTFGTNRRIVLPDRAVVKQEGSGQRFVYVVNPGNTVSYVPVTIGKHIGNEYEIIDGIPEGAVVVVTGQAGLKDGIAVEIQ